MKRSVCIVTGSRAEYGLLHWLMREIAQCEGLRLQIIVTGTHLSPEHGLTWQELEADGFTIDYQVEMLLSSDTPVGVSKSMGLGMIGFADAYSALNPDLLVVLGDRFEIFSAVSAALIARIPVAHLHGGEVTEGAFDEAIRHSITKMSHLHFVATEHYRRRVIQLGEQPERVFALGALGVDGVKKTALLSKAQVEQALDFSLGEKNLLITFHPVTLDAQSAQTQFNELLAALSALHDTHLLFTRPNADTGGHVINDLIDAFVKAHPHNARVYTSLGRLRYLSTMRYVDAVVGNSSSGLLEAPSMKVATINVGDRQKGRVRAKSVIDCEPRAVSIGEALERVYSKAFQSALENVQNPYGKGDSAQAICAVLQRVSLDNIVKKSFYDMPSDNTP